MKKFFQTGGAFMLVALLCISAGLLSGDRGALSGVGVFFLVMALVVRAKYTKKQPTTGESKGKGKAT